MTMHMTSVDITSDDYDMIETALKLVMSNGVQSSSLTSGFNVWRTNMLERVNALEFDRSIEEAPEGWTKFPCFLEVSDLATLIRAWLQDINRYPTSPDTDGTAKRAWRIESGQRMGLWDIGFRVTPAWTVYGK